VTATDRPAQAVRERSAAAPAGTAQAAHGYVVGSGATLCNQHIP